MAVKRPLQSADARKPSFFVDSFLIDPKISNKMSMSGSAPTPFGVKIDFEADAAQTEAWLRRLIQRAREAKRR